MPAVLIPVITAAGVTGGITIGATTITYASILAYAITTGAALGASFLLAGRQKDKGSSQQVSVKQALPPRTRSYGRVKVGGAYGFMETSGGHLFQLFIHGEGEWDAIEEWWLNDQNAGLSGGLVTVLPWMANIAIESHLGSASQAASSMLDTAFVAWTPTHRLQGLCYSAMRLGWVPEKVFQKVYPNGVPGLRVVGRAAKVLDPRSAFVGWSENPSLCIMDHLVHADGLRIPLAMIDQPSFATFANVCDQGIARSAGGPEPRYRVGLTYQLTDTPLEVHRRLLQSCDAEIYPLPSGKIGIRGGVYEAPTVTLNGDQITSYRYQRGNEKLAAFNLLKLTCTNPAADYQPVEIDPWEDAANQAALGVLQQDLTLDQVPSWTQARRLGKIAFHKGNPPHKLTVQTGPDGIIALGERVVRVELSELALAADFLLVKCELRFDGTQLVGCDLDLVSIEASAYDWSIAEEGAAPVTPGDTRQDANPPEPTGLALSLVRVQATAGLYLVKIRATVDALPGTQWQTVGRYRKVGASDWIEMVPDGDWSVISDVVDDGGDYEVQAAHSAGSSSAGTVGAWTDIETISTVADPTAPDLPSSLGVSVGSGSAVVSWFAPTSPNYFSSVLYRGTTNNFHTASQVEQLYGAPGQLIEHSESLSAGTYYWWVAATNRSGTQSAPVGPASGNVT